MFPPPLHNTEYIPIFSYQIFHHFWLMLSPYSLKILLFYFITKNSPGPHISLLCFQHAQTFNTCLWNQVPCLQKYRLSVDVLHSVQHQNSDPHVPTTQAPSKSFHRVSRPPTTLVSVFGTPCLNPARPSPLRALIWLP